MLTKDHIYLNKLSDFSCRFVKAWMTLKNLIRTWYFCYSKNANKINLHKQKSEYILPAQSQQWKLSNKVCNLFKVNKKRHQNNLIDTKTLRNIDISSGVYIVNFEKILHLLLVYHSWISGSVAGWVYQQISKCRQVKIM